MAARSHHWQRLRRARAHRHNRWGHMPDPRCYLLASAAIRRTACMCVWWHMLDPRLLALAPAALMLLACARGLVGQSPRQLLLRRSCSHICHPPRLFALALDACVGHMLDQLLLALAPARVLIWRVWGHMPNPRHSLMCGGHVGRGETGSAVPLKNGVGVLEAFFHFSLGSCRVVKTIFVLLNPNDLY